MDKFKTVLHIKPNEVTANGRAYSEGALDKAFKEFLESKSPCYVTYGAPDPNMFDMRNVIGVCESIEKENGRYVAEIRLVTSSKITPDVFKHCDVMTFGHGKLTRIPHHIAVVTDFEIGCLYVEPKPTNYAGQPHDMSSMESKGIK